MGLRFDPVGGGKFKQLVEQIIEAERAPIRNMEKHKGIEESKIKLFREFKGKFSAFQTAIGELNSLQKFIELKADLGDGKELMDVSINKEKAKPGSYVLEVEELARRSAMITNGFKDPDEPVMGLGFVVAYKENGDKFETFVDEHQSSLRGIARAINEVPDSPITATVIQDAYDMDRPWKLIVSSKKDGDPSSVEIPELYFLDGKKDIWIDKEADSQNAILKVNGFPVETAGNDVSDFVEGVNIHVKAARPDHPFTLNIREDVEKISAKVKGMVDSANEILKFINIQNKVDASSDTRTMFTGDTSLQAIEYRLRNVMHEGFPVGNVNEDSFRLVWLNEMGLQFNKDGAIVFDEKKFNTALEKDFDGVSEAITGPMGFAKQVGDLIAGYVRPGSGLLATREQGLQSRVKTVEKNIEDAERRMDIRSKALTEKFSRLQSTLGALQQQQQYMQSAMAGIGGGGITSQLMGGG